MGVEDPFTGTCQKTGYELDGRDFRDFSYAVLAGVPTLCVH